MLCGCTHGVAMERAQVRRPAAKVAVSPPLLPCAPRAVRERNLGRVLALGLGGAQAQEGRSSMCPTVAAMTSRVIDTPTNAPAPTPIPVGIAPTNASVRGDQSLVYVTNGTATMFPSSMPPPIPSSPPSMLGPSIVRAITPNGTSVYVANHGSNTVSVINTATNTVGRPSRSEPRLPALQSLRTEHAPM